MAWPLLAAQVGGGIAGGLLSNISARSRTAEEKTGINDILGANQLAFRRAEGLAPIASSFLQRGSDTLAPSIDYWSKILSGDRQAINEAIGPETTRIAQNYEGAKTAATQFAPMGGGRSQLLAELPFRRGQDISALVANLRPEAAQQLSTIANQLSQLGLDSEQIINMLLQGIGGRGTSAAGIGLNSRGMTADATMAGARGGAEIGRSIYDLLTRGGGRGGKTGGGGIPDWT